jgi:hypothetical protein
MRAEEEEEEEEEEEDDNIINACGERSRGRWFILARPSLL